MPDVPMFRTPDDIPIFYPILAHSMPEAIILHDDNGHLGLPPRPLRLGRIKTSMLPTFFLF